MQNRRLFAVLLLATMSGVGFVAACGGDDDDGATNNSGIQTKDAAPEADVTTAPVDSGLPHYATNDSDGSTASGDDDTTNDGGTCLDTTAIDQTQYRYVKAAPVLSLCTNDEVDTLVAYYIANGALTTFTVHAWKQTISAACAACAFVDDGLRNATVWRPIVTVGDAIDVIDLGGCVEHLGGTEACGQAFQQYEDCQTDACVSRCTTQSEYAACRADPALFTTACKAATDAVNAACGASTINQYEATCNFGVQFEAPVRLACVGKTGDAGTADAGDSGADASQ